MKHILGILLLILVVGCGQKGVSGDVVKDTLENHGIKISQAELDANGEFVHNIFNFEKTNVTVQVTTICYGDGFKVINDSDSYVMTLPPESVAGWKPRCPENTVKYQIDIKNSTG